MEQVNKKWIDDKMRMLSSSLGIFKMNPTEFYFEPTNNIYEKLASGEEKDLQCISLKIVNHLGITHMPIVKYDWGLKIEPEVAGQTEITNFSRHIQIPFFYVGKKYALGSILAHEITHTFLIPKGIILEDVNENEMFTDLATVFLGLGKLFLNGLITKMDQYSNIEYRLGYLPIDLVAYCYKKVIAYRSISSAIAIKNLLPKAQDMIENL